MKVVLFCVGIFVVLFVFFAGVLIGKMLELSHRIEFESARLERLDHQLKKELSGKGVSF